MGFFRSLRRASRPASGQPGVSEVLGRIEALGASGRRVEALAYAEDHALRLDDTDLWLRIGLLRMDAVGEAVAGSSPRGDWPPALPDPFPGFVGIPEIDAASLDWQTVGGAVLHHGSLLVRGMFDESISARLRNGIDQALEGYDAWYDEAIRSPTDASYLALPVPFSEPLSHMRPWSRENGGIWAAEAPRLFQTMLDIYRERGLIDAVGGYLGERPLLSVGKTVFRRAEPSTQGIFHQDGAFMGADIRTINIWTALSDCGTDAPGLEVVARRIPGIVPTGTSGAILDWSVARDQAEIAADGAPIVFPEFRSGDSLIFDQLMLHATGIRPGMTRRRYALESWFFAPSAYPADQVPIVI